MYSVSAGFLAALRQSHAVSCRVDAYQGLRCIARDIPFTDGTVSVSSGSGVHRKLDLNIADPSLWDLLAPVGTELRAWRGIRYPGGDEELVPLGVFSLDQQSMSVVAGSAIQISSAPDRWARVQRARFELPRVSEHALTAVQSIANLVGEVVPTSVDTGGVTDYNPISGALTVLQVWDKDRDQAITGLCTQSGTEAFFGPRGELTIRDIPTMDSAAVWNVHAGRDGVMLAGTATRDRTRVFNVVVVISSKTDGTAPFAPQVVEDNDPMSPTNVNGPYGRAPFFLTTATIGTAAEAQAAGRALLAKTRGRFVDMTVSALTNPALEAGDTISVTGVAGTALYVVDSFSVPLSTEGTQALTLRSLAAVTADTGDTGVVTGGGGGSGGGGGNTGGGPGDTGGGGTTGDTGDTGTGGGTGGSDEWDSGGFVEDGRKVVARTQFTGRLPDHAAPFSYVAIRVTANLTANKLYSVEVLENFTQLRGEQQILWVHSTAVPAAPAYGNPLGYWTHTEAPSPYVKFLARFTPTTTGEYTLYLANFSNGRPGSVIDATTPQSPRRMTIFEGPFPAGTDDPGSRFFGDDGNTDDGTGTSGNGGTSDDGREIVAWVKSTNALGGLGPAPDRITTAVRAHLFSDQVYSVEVHEHFSRLTGTQELRYSIAAPGTPESGQLVRLWAHTVEADGTAQKFTGEFTPFANEDYMVYLRIFSQYDTVIDTTSAAAPRTITIYKGPLPTPDPG